MIEHWTELGLGLWLIISPWLLGFSSISVMKWSNVIVGLLLVLINAWSIFGEPAPHAAEHGAREAKK